MTYTNHIRVMDAAAKAPTGRPTADPIFAEPAETRGGLATILCCLLFILALPTETGAWYWAGANFTNLDTQGVRSVIPQYTLWAVLPFAVAFHLNTYGFKYYKRAIGVFLPLLAIGVISSLQGLFPLYSLRLIVFWLACASVCVVVCSSLTQRQAVRLLFYAILVELILSFGLALLAKSAGLVPDNRAPGGTAWRGVFPNNITLGGMAGWGLTLTLFRKHVGWLPTLMMFGFAMICLYEAHSAGAIFAVSCSIIFAAAVILLRRTALSTVSRVLVLGLGSVTAASVVIIAAPLILAALGRDPTLTGRTEIWQLYLPAALEHPILGQGPGAFSAPSDVTASLFYRLIHLGEIRTPHSMYIALLGEVGFLGLAAQIGALFYIAFVLPFRSSNLVASVGAVMIMTNGLVEIDMLYAPGVSLFLLLMLLSIREEKSEPLSSASPRPLPQPPP
jgi:O-antigen ligase